MWQAEIMLMEGPLDTLDIGRCAALDHRLHVYVYHAALHPAHVCDASTGTEITFPHLHVGRCDAPNDRLVLVHYMLCMHAEGVMNHHLDVSRRDAADNGLVLVHVPLTRLQQLPGGVQRDLVRLVVVHCRVIFGKRLPHHLWHWSMVGFHGLAMNSAAASAQSGTSGRSPWQYSPFASASFATCDVQGFVAQDFR